MESERRRAKRFPLRVPAEYENGGHGTGTTENLSRSGVLMTNTTVRAQIGTDIVMRMSLYPGSFETPFHGRVVRVTDDGFAAVFERLSEAASEALQAALPGPTDLVD